MSENKADDEESKEEDDLSPFPAEVMSQLPPGTRSDVKTLIGMSMQGIRPTPNPLLGKINEAHIDKILEIAEKDDERSFKDSQASRLFALFYVVLFCALFVFFTVFLISTNNKELYQDVTKILISFLGGLGGGYGIKSYIDRGKDS